MANRREFLSQLQDQLSSWADWVRQLEDQAQTGTAKLREDAKIVYEQRATQVKDLIQQGRGQLERLSEASDDAWDGVSGGAEQAWVALKDAAASLAAQATPAANEPTVEPIVKAKAVPKPRPKPKLAPAPVVTLAPAARAKPAAKKKSLGAKKKSAVPKAKAGSSAKAKRGGPKRKAVPKRKTVAKRKPATKEKSKAAARKPARKK